MTIPPPIRTIENNLVILDIPIPGDRPDQPHRLVIHQHQHDDGRVYLNARDAAGYRRAAKLDRATWRLVVEALAGWAAEGEETP